MLPRGPAARSPAAGGSGSPAFRSRPALCDSCTWAGSPGESRTRSSGQKTRRCQSRLWRTLFSLKRRKKQHKPDLRSGMCSVWDNKERNKVKTDYLLGNDEHSDQEEGDIYAAHHLGVFHQPNRPQDGCIFYAVKKKNRTFHSMLFGAGKTSSD